jgi:hypothetical protein
MARKQGREKSYPVKGQFCVFDLGVGQSHMVELKKLCRIKTSRADGRKGILALIVDVTVNNRVTRDGRQELNPEFEVSLLAENGQLLRDWAWYPGGDETLDIDDLWTLEEE